MLAPNPNAIMESPPGAETVLGGKRYVYFAGTGYLGLAGHPAVIEAACASLHRYGVHTATSRGGYGNNPATLEVERRAAEFFNCEDAFYFTSGYMGNHILVRALAAENRVLFLDEAAHYCVQEAALLAGRPIHRFQHRDAADLQRQCKAVLRPGEHPLVMTDGVFSMSGFIAPIPDYVRVLEPYERSALVVDDAHAFAVLGERGRGSLEHFGLWDSRVNAGPDQASSGLYVCGTMSKAIGGFGGIIPGRSDFLLQLRSTSHYFDGASAPSSADAAASAKALEILAREPALRLRLRENIAQLRGGLRSLGFTVTDEPTANFCLRIGDAENMRRIHQQLLTAGLLVPYVSNYAGLGAKTGALRFAVCAQHTPAMIERLLSELRRIL